MANYVDETYIGMLSNRLEGLKKVGQNWNARCPICGDSAKKKSKKRFWILTKEQKHTVYCHNCGISMSFRNFLKTFDPALYKSYIYDLMKDRNELSKKLEVSAPKESRVLEVKTERSLYIQAFLSICIPIADLPKEHKAISYLDKRQIPEEKRKYIFYIDNIKDISNIDTKGKYNNRIIDNDSRIVMPVWSKTGLIGVSCRAIDPNAARRYLIFKFNDELPLIFNLYDIDGNMVIDPKKPVYVTEGAMDSLFLDNAIAVNGSDLKRVLKMLNSLDLVFLPDNEPRNKEIVKVYKQIIGSNNSIVIFPNTIQEKDINEMVLKFGGNSIRDVINTNTLKGPLATLRLNEWKRC